MWWRTGQCVPLDAKFGHIDIPKSAGFLSNRLEFPRGIMHICAKSTGGLKMAEGKRLTKAQVYADLAERTGLEKKDIQSVFGGMLDLIERELGPNGPGEVVLPDLVKLKVKLTEAREERMGRDPFTGEERMFPAKPASRKVKATALKPLKDRLN